MTYTFHQAEHGGWYVKRADRRISRRVHAWRTDAQREALDHMFPMRAHHGPDHPGWDPTSDALNELCDH